jgi:hypothetical protein
MATSDLLYKSASDALAYRDPDGVGGDDGLRYKMPTTAKVYIFGAISAGPYSYAEGEHTLDFIDYTLTYSTIRYYKDTIGVTVSGSVAGKVIELSFDLGVWNLRLICRDVVLGGGGYAESKWTSSTLSGVYDFVSHQSGGTGATTVSAVYVNALSVYDFSALTTQKRFFGGDTDASLTTAVATAQTNLDADSSTDTGYTYIHAIHNVVRSGASSYVGSAGCGYAQIVIPSGVAAVELRFGWTRYTQYPASTSGRIGLRTSEPGTGTACRTFDTLLYSLTLGATADQVLDASSWSWGSAATRYLCLNLSTGSWSGVSLGLGENAGFSAVIQRLVFIGASP